MKIHHFGRFVYGWHDRYYRRGRIIPLICEGLAEPGRRRRFSVRMREIGRINEAAYLSWVIRDYLWWSNHRVDPGYIAESFNLRTEYVARNTAWLSRRHR